MEIRILLLSGCSEEGKRLPWEQESEVRVLPSGRGFAGRHDPTMMRMKRSVSATAASRGKFPDDARRIQAADAAPSRQPHGALAQTGERTPEKR